MAEPVQPSEYKVSRMMTAAKRKDNVPFGWYIRKCKTIGRFLVIFVSTLVIGHIVVNQSFLDVSWISQPRPKSRFKDLDLSLKIEYSRKIISRDIRADLAEGNNKNNVISADAFNDQVEPTDDTNVSYHVVYSEKEMQVQLKAIHDKGAELIKLEKDKCRQRLPQCLIIGNIKSGTQELLEFMSMHPRIRIYREPYYELNFFAQNYGKGLEWYKKQMPCSYENQITVEKSPGYLQDPGSPARIHAMNSSIKVIVLVREPVARALAHFSYTKHMAQRYDNNFDSCALASSNGAIDRYCFAIKHSIYDDGMERYLQFFKRNQIKIIDSDGFKRDPFAVLHDIETFLDIEHVISKESFVFIKEKGFHCVRSVLNSSLVACYGKDRGRTVGTEIRHGISNSTMNELKEFFKPRNDRFFQQVSQIFNWEY